MKRRAVLELAAAVLVAPVYSIAQTQRRFRVGLLAGADEKSATPNKKQFIRGLRDLGYEIGRNLVLDIRYADGNTSRYAPLADELIALRPDVLVSVDSGAVVLKAKTATIPIVLLTSTDPVADGLVGSLAHPGTNVTGLVDVFEQLVAKHIELLAEIVPKLMRVGFFDLERPTNAESGARFQRAAEKVAATKGLKLIVARGRDPESVRGAFEIFERTRVEAIVVAGRVETYEFRNEILGHARRLRLPTISALPPGWWEAGGLLSYGPNFRESYRYCATFVDRILRGAKPADLPVEQIKTYHFVVNLKAAREIGITIPQSVLVRADEVIQ